MGRSRTEYFNTFIFRVSGQSLMAECRGRSAVGAVPVRFVERVASGTPLALVDLLAAIDLKY